MARFIVFDVETPNRKNNRISAIGITVVEEGKISKEFYSLFYNYELTDEEVDAMLANSTLKN